MKQTKFSWLMFFLTLGLSGVSAFVYTSFADALAWGKGFGQCLLVGGFFMIPLVLGLLGVFAALWIRGKFASIYSRGSKWISVLLATVGAFVFGVGMQALYMIDFSGKAKVSKPQETDIMVLIDCSGSMDLCMDTCKEAATTLIQQMDEANSAQLIPFCEVVLPNGLDMTLMDETGKNAMIDQIAQLYPNGGTSFDTALSVASDEFANSPTGNSNQAVIILTDCNDNVSSEVQQLFYEADIPVYSVSIVDKGLIYEWMRADYVDFIEATGGFDVTIQKDATGNIDLTELTSALTNAYSSIKVGVEADEVIVFFGNEGFNLYRAIIRLITLVGYAILTAYVYYQYFSVKSLIVHGAVGVVSFAWITVSGLLGTGVSLVMAYLLFVLLYWTAYTVYRKAAYSQSAVWKHR